MNSATSSHAEQMLNFKYKGTAFAVGTGTASWSSGPALYLGLLRTAALDGTITEVSGGSYARVSLATSDWNTATTSNYATTITLGTAKTFATPTADWGDITHVGIFTASSSGSLLGAGALAATLTVTNGNAPIIPAGASGVVIRYGYLGG